MRDAAEDREVTRLLGEHDRICARLSELGIDLAARDRSNNRRRRVKVREDHRDLPPYHPQVLIVEIDGFPRNVERWVRMRDGGTTIVTLSNGDRIVKPSPLRRGDEPTLNGEPIELEWNAS